MMAPLVLLRTLVWFSFPFLIAGCAISPDFGETDLVSVKDRFGLVLPTSPQFSLKRLGEDRYYLAVHQGAPLIAESSTRARFLHIAAEKVAIEECKVSGKSMSALRIQQRGDAGWVSLVGEFDCGSAPKVAQQPTPAPKAKAATNQFEPVGTAFFVNAVGELVTNKHVIDGCTAIYVLVGNKQRSAVLRGADSAMDLAVLSVDATPTAHPRIRTARDDRLGETIIVAGYPLQGILSAGLNITTGTVSALAGLLNNTQILQITAPVQPGNSGGPLLDENGSVAGVVVSKLNAVAVAKYTGDIPQNVNFAIKSSVLRGFLEANGIDYTNAGTSTKSSVVKIAESAKAFTLPIFCRK